MQTFYSATSISTFKPDAGCTTSIQFLAGDMLLLMRVTLPSYFCIHFEYKLKKETKQLTCFREIKCKALYNVYHLGQGWKTVPDSVSFSSMNIPVCPFCYFPQSISNHRITESQNSRGWKGPLWVI